MPKTNTSGNTIYANKKKRIIGLIKDGTLEKLCSGADTDKELYTSLAIGKTMWFRMKKEIPELAELIIRTRHETFLEIKGAMKKRALGYNYEEEEQEIYVDQRTGAKTKGKVRKITRHVPPDITAQKLLIANLKKAECREDNEDSRLEELARWTNSTETLEVKTDNNITLAVDDAIKSVLKEITDDK